MSLVVNIGTWPMTKSAMMKQTLKDVTLIWTIAAITKMISLYVKIAFATPNTQLIIPFMPTVQLTKISSGTGTTEMTNVNYIWIILKTFLMPGIVAWITLNVKTYSRQQIHGVPQWRSHLMLIVQSIFVSDQNKSLLVKNEMLESDLKFKIPRLLKDLKDCKMHFGFYYSKMSCFVAKIQ